MPPFPFRAMSLIKFAIRDATAFVGHSFAEDDKPVVQWITQFLTRLGVTCESGVRPEPRSVSEKVRERLLAAELFVGVFTRREQKPDGTYATAPWLIEEKAVAVQAGKRLLLFVEDGVQDAIGGLQGDHEYVRFRHEDLTDGLLKAMDYVLAVTTVPLRCQVDPATNNVNLSLGPPNVSVESEINELTRQRRLRPDDESIVLALAEQLEKNNQTDLAMSELQMLKAKKPLFAEAHHKLAHLFEKTGRLDDALQSYQNALDRNTANFKYHRCYSRAIYSKARVTQDPEVRRRLLERAGRMLKRAEQVGGEQNRKTVESDLFLVDEALSEFTPNSTNRSAVSNSKKQSRDPKTSARRAKKRR